MKNRKTRVSSYGLIVQENKILLCRISKLVPNWKGFWTLPGGGIKFGEDPKVAMKREVLEETGLSVEGDGIVEIDSLLTGNHESEYHSVRIIYKTKSVTGKLAHERDGSTDQCKWFSKMEIEKVNLVELAQKGVLLSGIE